MDTVKWAYLSLHKYFGKDRLKVFGLWNCSEEVAYMVQKCDSWKRTYIEEGRGGQASGCEDY